MEWHILWVTIIVIIVNVYRYYHNGDDGYNNLNEDTDNNIKETVMEEVISTRQLALNTIEKIGSEPKYDDQTAGTGQCLAQQGGKIKN